MLNLRNFTLVTIVLAAALARLLPHPPNVTPIAAMALFGGAYFTSRWAAILVPLAAMALSDLVIGTLVYDYGFYHTGMPWVYGALAATVGLGMLITHGKTPVRVLNFKPFRIFFITIGASLLFFIIANFGVWMSDRLYPQTGSGLVACYTAALPWLRNTLAGNLFFVALLFGVFELAQHRFAALRPASKASVAA